MAVRNAPLPLNLTFVKAFEEQIDACLGDPVWRSENVEGMYGNKHYKVLTRGTAAILDKQYLVKLYQDAGWYNVRVLNSEENGEPSGLCQITLYENKGGGAWTGLTLMA